MKLALAMQKNEILLPEEDMEELRSYEVEITTATATPRFNAPSGLHDDRVIADALAVWQAMNPIQVFF